MINKFKNTILFDFLLGVIVVLSLLIGVSTYINISNQKSSIIDRMSENISSQGIILRELGKDAINYGDLSRNQEILMKLYENSISDIYKLSIYKFEEEIPMIISSTDYESIGEVLEGEELYKRLMEKPILMNIINEEKNEYYEYYEYIFAIKDEGELIGAFEYVITSKIINSTHKKALISNIMLASVALILIIVFTTLLLYYRIYAPILTLIKEVRKIKNGEIAYDVKLNVKNELGDLADEINMMKSSIWASSLENRMANPLTGLMGLLDTIEVANDKIEKGEMFGVVSINLKNITPYKIKYGLNSGEDIIRLTLEIIEKTIELLNIGENNLTQIGDNHFLMLLMPEFTEEFAKNFTADFDTEILSLYKDRSEDGVVKLVNIEEEEKAYPLIVAEVGVLNNTGDMEFKDYKDIEEKILEIEEKFYEKKDESFYVMYTKDGLKQNKNGEEEISEMEQEAEDLELEENLLSGLEDL